MPQLRVLDSGWRLLDDNPNEWEWSNRAQRQHDLSQWREVTLPASVQETLIKTGEIKHPYYDLNSREAEWLEHRDWVYGLDFDLPPLPPNQRVFLEFEAVDDRCLVYLNHILLDRHEGPGAPFVVEIGPHLHQAPNQLIVVVPAPQPEYSQIGWTEHTRSLKGRMGFGWDFAPRIVRVGITGQVKLRTTGPGRITNLWVRPELSPNHQRASLLAEARVDGPASGKIHFSLRKENQLVANSAVKVEPDGTASARLVIDNPELWWPNGWGEQPLYTLQAECEDGSDLAETTVGVREIKWERRTEAPASEWPFILQVNGQRLFQKGWNWVPADQLGGAPAEERAMALLELARQAGVNMLRCWGGGDPETAAFYNQCDRLGLLVWQEFPLSSAGISNAPPRAPDYLRRLEVFAQAVVRARRNHPSLAVWGGGNELTEPGSSLPLTPKHPYARTLKRVISQYDPDRQFRPSSPLGPQFDADPDKGELWDVHGPWEYSQRQLGQQYWRFNSIKPLLHSEFGLPGEASLETKHQYLSAQYRTRSNPGRRHHGGAWWDHHDALERVFGRIEDEEQFVLASQWLQAEGLRYAIEESRRRWPHTTGVFPWQLNEPWPLAVCTSAVEYGGRPKLAYYAVRNAYRPRLATAHYQGLDLAKNEPLKVEIWLLNEQAAASGEITISLTGLNQQELISPLTQAYTVPANSSLKLLDLELPLPNGFEGVVVLSLALDSSKNKNRYLFSNLSEAPLKAALAHADLLRGMFMDEN
jgi:beta-mannosidase